MSNVGILSTAARLISLVWAVCIFTSPGFAADLSDTNDFARELRGIRPPELPAKAAALVALVERPHRSRTAVDLVRVVVRQNPAALTAVVGSIIKAAPETAEEVVRNAALERRDLVAAIARAAIHSSPAQARDLIAALCRVAPGDEREIALAAAQASPLAGREILLGVCESDAGLRPYLEAEIPKPLDSKVFVARCFDKAAQARLRASTLSATAGQPRPTWPPGQSGGLPPRGDPNPPGGRNYARP